MQDWYDIYKERMNKRYTDHIARKYKTFIDAIIATESFTFIELGCGAGNITKALRQHPTHSTHLLVDNCPRMLSLALENNVSPMCSFVCSDITVPHNNLTFPRLQKRTVHSHGVLEHFSDKQIQKILMNANLYAPKQVHYVPGAKYETPSRGDERLMSISQWEDILSKVDIPQLKFEVSTFNDGYDILIKTEVPCEITETYTTLI